MVVVCLNDFELDRRTIVSVSGLLFPRSGSATARSRIELFVNHFSAPIYPFETLRSMRSFSISSFTGYEENGASDS